MAFDQTKIRDIKYRDKFQQKLEEIKGVRSKHTFIDYALNQSLFDDLGNIYRENLQDYRQHYQANQRKYDRVRLLIETNKEDIHPLRYRRVERFYEEIEAALAFEDYQKNREAKKIIRHLEKHIEKAVEEYMGWRENFKEWETRLNQIKTKVWAEDFSKLEKEYQEKIKFLVGARIPALPIVVDEKVVEIAIEKRNTAVESLRKKVRNSIGLWRRLISIEDKYYSESDFEELKASLELSLRKKRFKRVSLITLVIGVLGGIGWAIPQAYQFWMHKQAWNKTVITGTIEAYEDYLISYPNGTYVAQAQDSILKIPEGKISGQSDNQGLAFDYEGELKGAIPHGKGIANYKDGAIYDGYWNMGVRDSFGVHTTADKHVYTGQWKEGTKEGKGTLKFPNGNIYKGNFRQDRYWGKGTFTQPGGAKYDGQWRDGFQEGKGIYTYKDGSRYEGSWKGGVYHGEGTLKEASGIIYSGNWRNGKKEGEGIQTWTDGREHRGVWTLGERTGSGTLSWPNGSSFVGIWVADSIQGQGMFTSRFRDEYKGFWKGSINNVTLFDGEGNVFKRGRLEGGLFIGE